MQARLEPIAIPVAPRRKLAAGDVALFDDQRRLAGVGEIFRGGEPGGARADDEDVGVGYRDQRTNACGCATVG